MIKVRFLFQQLCAGVRCGAATVRFDAGQRRACARLLSRVGRHGLPRRARSLPSRTVPKCSNRMCVNVCSNAYEIYLGTQCYCMLRFTTHS
jgi:hypothetical protein